MSDISETVPAGQLRAFIERIERVEEEIRELNADKSEIYKELRGCGFDVKAVRQCVAARKLDSAEREERNAIFDLYWEALTGASRVHVHEGRGVDHSSTPPHDPETGELTDTQEQPETAQPIQAPKTRPEVVAKSTTHIDTPASEKGLAKEMSEADSSGGMQDEEAIHPATISPTPSSAPRMAADDEAAQANPIVVGAHSNPLPSSPGDAVKAPEAGTPLLPASGAVLSEADVPAFLRKSAADYRPNCLNPDACGASGLQHCYTCRRAMEAAESEVA